MVLWPRWSEDKRPVDNVRSSRGAKLDQEYVVGSSVMVWSLSSSCGGWRRPRHFSLLLPPFGRQLKILRQTHTENAKKYMLGTTQCGALSDCVTLLLRPQNQNIHKEVHNQSTHITPICSLVKPPQLTMDIAIPLSLWMQLMSLWFFVSGFFSDLLVVRTVRKGLDTCAAFFPPCVHHPPTH